MKCPYCGFDAVHYPSSDIVYAGRDFGPVWVCSRYPTCDAYVGCHKDGDGKRPLGRLADKALRAAIVRAHAAFDPLWKDLGLRKAYVKLADALGVPVEECNIGMFDEAMCARVVAVCGQLRQEARVVRTDSERYADLRALVEEWQTARSASERDRASVPSAVSAVTDPAGQPEGWLSRFMGTCEAEASLAEWNHR